MGAPVGNELFTRVSTARASADVVAQIHAALESGELGPGDRLPPERELAAQLGVSRVTVRDALRVLEANGLVAIRVGAHGGAFVTAPAPDHVSEGLANLLMMSQVSPADITEARMVFELGSLRLVCERATTEDLAELTEICDRSEQALRQGTFDVALSAEFHIRLAKSAHNVAISLVTEAFQEPMLRSLVKAKAIDPHMGDPGIHEHRRLVAAIAEGDVREARNVMRQHLGRTARRIKSEKPTRRTASG